MCATGGGISRRCLWTSVVVNLLVVLCRISEGNENYLSGWHEFPTECKLTRGGQEYAGTLSRTMYGKTCQAWSSRTPHYNYYVDSKVYPEGNAQAAGNHCRNPNHVWHLGPWCYTTDSRVRWQRCRVNFCECKRYDNGTDYEGLIQRTSSNRRCQYWRDQTPHPHNFTAADLNVPSLYYARNYCRNPRGSRPLGPWCYTTDSRVEWDYCDVPTCSSRNLTYWYRPTTTAVTTASTALPSTSTTPVTTTSSSVSSSTAPTTLTTATATTPSTTTTTETTTSSTSTTSTSSLTTKSTQPSTTRTTQTATTANPLSSKTSGRPQHTTAQHTSTTAGPEHATWSPRTTHRTRQVTHKEQENTKETTKGKEGKDAKSGASVSGSRPGYGVLVGVPLSVLVVLIAAGVAGFIYRERIKAFAYQRSGKHMSGMGNPVYSPSADDMGGS